MKIERIDDPADPRVADYRGVKDPEWVRERGLFIGEGHEVLHTLLTRSALRTRSVLLTDTAHARLESALAGRDVAVYLAAPAVLEAIARFDIHQGCLALGERPQEPALEGLLAGLGTGPRRVVVLDRVTNPDNIGAVFRNALAFNVDLVALGQGCAHPLYRKAIRTSMGAALRVPWTTLPDWPRELDALRAAGFRLLALAPDPEATELDAYLERAPLPERLALLLGHEGDGLGAPALAAADELLRIRIAPGVDSLNIATAAAIALHRFDRSTDAVTLPRVSAAQRRRGS